MCATQQDEAEEAEKARKKQALAAVELAERDAADDAETRRLQIALRKALHSTEVASYSSRTVR